MRRLIPGAYLLVTNLFFVKSALAVEGGITTTGVDVGNLPNPLGVTSIGGLIERVIDVLTFYVAAPVATLMVIIGAFQILSAGGDPEKFKTGRKTITYALVGFAVLFLADLFISLIQELLGVQQ